VEKGFIRPTNFLGKTCFQRHKFFKSETGLRRAYVSARVSAFCSVVTWSSKGPYLFL